MSKFQITEQRTPEEDGSPMSFIFFANIEKILKTSLRVKKENKIQILKLIEKMTKNKCIINLNKDIKIYIRNLTQIYLNQLLSLNIFMDIMQIKCNKSV